MNNHKYVRDEKDEIVAGDHYYILRLNGAKVNVSGNIINATMYNSKITEVKNKAENSLLKLDRNGGEITFENNVVTGIDGLGTVSESGGVLDSQIRYIRNRIEYKHGLYCKNAKSIDLVLEDNYLQASRYCIVTQWFSPIGSICIKNNVWYNSPNEDKKMEYCPIFLYEQNSSDYSLDSLIFTNNIFKGTSLIEKVILSKLPDADCFILHGNIINP